MSDDFFKTRMGARFYEHTMPEIAAQLKRIADALEKVNDAQDPSHVCRLDCPLHGARALGLVK